MTISNQKIVTRFAPSPTGFMHIGGVRTAIYAWAYAKQNNGIFILRIEDTDKEREVEGSIKHIIETFKWLGLDWDEGPDIGGPHKPYIQSERLNIYKKYAQILINKGLAYADPYSIEEVNLFRKKSIQEKKPFLYRDYRPKNPPKWNGTTPLRFKVTNIKSYEWKDEVRGILKAGEEMLDDFILIKSDGYPTYNFAHIIDDFEMGITHIMRADEFISSTPKFLSLYEALEIKRPKIITLPPILASDGKKKLGKRDGAKDVLQYREDGYLPEAIINFLILIGWNPGTDQEIITKDNFVKLFDISKISHSGGKFNEEKLAWINREYLKLLSMEKQQEYIKKFIPKEIKSLPNYKNKIINKITPIILERISCGKDILDMATKGELIYFFEKPIFKKNDLFFKASEKIEKIKYTNLSKYLTEAIFLIKNIPNKNFTKENIKNSLWSYSEKVGKGNLLWPIRYALSGRERSPDPFILAEILGKEETIKRLNYAVLLLLKT